jgi:cytoskeletal protein CcmA (bactofilin family)
MMRRILYSLVLLALLLLPAAPAYAQGGPSDGRVIIGQDFTLKSGETLSGDLVVIGGQVIVEKTAVVNGDVVVIGGSLKMDGQSSGNAVVIGGVVALGAESSVAGDLVTVGGTLQRADGSKIGGNVVTNMPPPSIKIPVTPQAEMPTIPPPPGLPIATNGVARAVTILLQAIGLAALAMLLTLFLHPQLDRVAQAVTHQPLMAGSIGLLTLLLAPIALVILVVTVLLIPVALAGVVLIMLAWLFGVVAFGMEVGDRFTKAIHQTWEPVLSAGIGTFLLAIVVGTINLVPCVGWLAPVIIGLVGLGAAVITRFGTQAVSLPGIVTPPVEPIAPGVALPPAS